LFKRYQRRLEEQMAARRVAGQKLAADLTALLLLAHINDPQNVT
jgi:hypothetical protein